MYKRSFLKYPGGKYSLLPWILDVIGNRHIKTWYEPFVGSCVVAMNVKADKYVLSDLNETLIELYSGIQNGAITHKELNEFLLESSDVLKTQGDSYYYEVRSRYNKTRNPYDFIFLNHTGFNGLVRYNKNNEYTTPFCKNPNVLSNSRIEWILSNFNNFYEFTKQNDVSFVHQSYDNALKNIKEDTGAFIYCDPPYICTSASYLGNEWTIENENNLKHLLENTCCDFIVSSWNNNKNENVYLTDVWGNYNIFSKSYSYKIAQHSTKKVNEILIVNADCSHLDKTGTHTINNFFEE